MLEQMYEVCKGEDLACSNEILNRMGQYSMVIDTVDNITKVRNTMVNIIGYLFGISWITTYNF